MNTEYVRKEEEEEEEEKEEERKEEGRSWRCARKTRTPHKGCGEKMPNYKIVKHGLLCALCGGGSAKALFSIKTHNHPRNPENRSPGLQNDCPGLKIDPQAFKITAHLGVETPRRSTPRAQRNGTVPGYARSALDMILQGFAWGNSKNTLFYVKT